MPSASASDLLTRVVICLDFIGGRSVPKATFYLSRSLCFRRSSRRARSVDGGDYEAGMLYSCGLIMPACASGPVGPMTGQLGD